MKKNLLLLIVFLFATQLYSQNEIDALRYSQQNIFGTAKFNSMGGSFGSLGGDFSNLSFNPAGIGLYQNSELTFTPILSMTEVNSSLNGNTFYNNQYGINISNFGFIATGINKDDQWKRINLGFGWNQLANYDSRFFTITKNSHSSLAELILEQAQGNTIDNLDYWGAEPAFWSDLIDLENNFVDTNTGWYAFDNGNYISHANPNVEKTQSKQVNSVGDMGEYVFSLGTSYEERVYFGATIGVPSIQYTETSSYTESDFADTSQDLSSFVYEENLLAYGSGINLKIGTIVRVGENTKLGGAIHSPSYISMEENYNTSITTNWKNGNNITENSPIGYFTYQITTPWKVIASFSSVINNQFLVNAELERIDYSFTQLYSDRYQFTDENNIIKDLYGEATNIRVGAEANLNPFKLRAGYALYGSPYKNNTEFEMENYSAGAGVDFGSSFIDFSYTISNYSSEYSMYNPDTETRALLNSESHYLLFTLGFRY